MSFSAASFADALAALNVTGNDRVGVGLTFQWELLDCFLAPHTCTTNLTLVGMYNFLDNAVKFQIPVAGEIR